MFEFVIFGGEIREMEYRDGVVYFIEGFKGCFFWKVDMCRGLKWRKVSINFLSRNVFGMFEEE